MDTRKYIKQKLSLLPNLPGSYQMKDKDGLIIYVGKAKNLKKRVSSYFNKTQTGKTLMLVNDICDFEYIVTDTELESLILEITLIKKYNPKYNILLKDDKSYPYIEFSNDNYPTLKVVRNINRKKYRNKLYGPFPNVKAARNTVDLLNRIYPLKKCNKIGKDVCLYYHIGECLGYCKYKNIDINNISKEIIAFLKGNRNIITIRIKKEMEDASNDLNYEKALELKNILSDIETTLEKQKIDLNSNYNFDLFAFYKKDNYLSIQIFFIRNGLLFGRDFDIVEGLDEELEYIIKFYDKGNILPKEIIVGDDIDTDLLSKYFNIKVISTKKGNLKKLYDMALDNAKSILLEKEEMIKKNNEQRLNAVNELNELLNKKIYRIEAFDNSHLFGTFYVGGMVVFEEFLANKNLYRKYKIDSNTYDDLNAMREVIYRRYFNSIMADYYLPDLIIVDGGELQLKVVKEVLNSLNLNIKIIGLKKNNKHKTSEVIDDNFNVLKVSSNLFVFLSRIQEEVHRYAISYHRNIKSKGMLSSFIDFVPGIGESRKKELLKKFGSLKKMKSAKIEELESVLPKNVALDLFNYLKEVE